MPRFYHVTSVRNRESITVFGLDWSRMGASPGIAGSRAPEVEGCFLCQDGLVDFFVRINNTGGPVDVWAVDSIAPDQLQTSPEGFEYLPGKIPTEQLSLVRQNATIG